MKPSLAIPAFGFLWLVWAAAGVSIAFSKANAPQSLRCERHEDRLDCDLQSALGAEVVSGPIAELRVQRENQGRNRGAFLALGERGLGTGDDSGPVYDELVALPDGGVAARALGGWPLWMTSLVAALWIGLATVGIGLLGRRSIRRSR